MRGLSTLSSSKSRIQNRALHTLDHRLSAKSDFYSLSNQYHSQSESKAHYPCAYHVGQKISNFCIHANCLLPLCPKCIKIHSEEHQKMGIHGNFATVQECIQECQTIQNQSVLRLEQILQVCEDMSSLHKQQLFLCRQQIQKAKQEMVDYIQSVFAFYQQQVDKLIAQTSREYEQQLLTYHKEIANLMVSEKVLAKKSQNPNLKLQFLIDFYSRSDLSVLLNSYAARIQAIKPQYVQLSINTYELERIKVIVKKYLDFGQLNSQIDKRLESNFRYQRVTMTSKTSEHSQNKRQDSLLSFTKGDTLKQFVRSPIKNLYSTPTQFESKNQPEAYGFTPKGEIAKLISQNLKRQSMLDSFHSPLESYSLQKSRRSRN